MKSIFKQGLPTERPKALKIKVDFVTSARVSVHEILMHFIISQLKKTTRNGDARKEQLNEKVGDVAELKLEKKLVNVIITTMVCLQTTSWGPMTKGLLPKLAKMWKIKQGIKGESRYRCCSTHNWSFWKC